MFLQFNPQKLCLQISFIIYNYSSIYVLCKNTETEAEITLKFVILRYYRD